MSEEKLDSKEIVVEKGKFLKWLDNYWYHYKWPTIVVAFFVVVLSVCLIQSWTNEEKDILVTYAGPTYLEADEKAAIESLLSDTLPEKFGRNERDGKAGLINYQIYSKEQMKQIEIENYEKDDPVYIDPVFNSNEYSSLASQYKMGNGSIYILEKWLYEEILDSDGTTDRLKPLSEIFDEVPECAIDAYGIRLGDTELYKNNPELQVLPADSIICLHEQIFGQKNYDKEIEAFKNFAKVAKNSENE